MPIQVWITLAESIAYTVLSGCGMDMEQLKDRYIFEYIHKFNTTDTLSVLGNAINSQVKPVMAEIGRAVRSYEKQSQKEFTNIYNKDIENAPDRDYNNNRNSSIDKDTMERGTENETGIQEGRGLPGTEYRDGRTAGRGDKEIRASEEKLPGGEQGRDFTAMVLSNRLTEHLLMVQGQAEERMDRIIKQMAETEGVDETLKAEDQMLWVQKMENIRQRAEEIVQEEIVYN